MDLDMLSTSSAGDEQPYRAEDGDEPRLIDIGNLATWTLSSFKPKFGVAELRDESTDKYWQSDGPQPHFIDIHFSKRVAIAEVQLYMNFGDDESYTPSKLAVLGGSGYHDLSEVVVREFEEPRGWVSISMANSGKDGLLKAFLVRLSVLANHQNGKDTHIRAIKVLSPETKLGNDDVDLQEDCLPFTSIAMLSHSAIR
ncbi:anaphase-promoting complex, subunit 10 [Dipodascopsis tothii]|uniref:anaphase-promoting complex, subunit 10 n=1 Tax=Dipodascopsis tothii TaxID=44089 RepID=UPI0034CF4D48